MCLFSRRYRRSRRDECSRLHYFAEKDRLFEVKAVLLFCNLPAIISEITSPIVGIFLQRLHIISNLFVSSQL